MAKQRDSFSEMIIEQLEQLPLFRSKRMFGGIGLFCADRFFGLIYRGSVYFRTDDVTRTAYTDLGMHYFQPNEKQYLKKYFEVPANIIEDNEAFLSWAETALRVGEDSE